MTTIAYRDGIMAADTQLSRGGEPSYGSLKIAKTNKFLIGLGGDACADGPVLAFIREHEHLLDEEDTAFELYRYWEDLKAFGDYSLIMVDRKGAIYQVTDGPPVPIPNTFDAIGSGGQYAMGAMMHGATAAEAVRTARALDIYTGGHITTIRF
jgi:ATP-dependent protease HslVU (ClpYQ) peptidase subunit